MNLKKIVLSLLMIFIGCLQEEEPLKKKMMRSELESYISTIPADKDLDIDDDMIWTQLESVPFMTRELLPNWTDSLDLGYMDPTKVKMNTMKFASNILKEKIRSHDKKDKLISAYLFTLKPDTSDISFLDELQQNETKREMKYLLSWSARNIEKNYYKMRYGLLEYRRVRVSKPRLSYLEAPVSCDKYINFQVTDQGDYVFIDAKVSLDSLINQIQTISRNYNKLGVLIDADKHSKWLDVKNIIDLLMKDSKTSNHKISIFLLSFTHWRGLQKGVELGINFPELKPGLKDTGVTIKVESNLDIYLNSQKVHISDLTNLEHHKVVEFIVDHSADYGLVAGILSYIKNTNAKGLKLMEVN